MKYLHTMVRVKNLEISLDFYCNKLGLVEVKRIQSEQGRFSLVFLAAPGQAEDLNAPLIELTYNWPNQNEVPEDYSVGRNFGHLAYGVDNIFEACQKLLEAGVTINRPPRDGNMAFFKSPDGVSIELLQKGAALEPVEPWLSMENIGTW